MKIKTMLLYTLIAVPTYILVSIIVHHYLFPLKKIEYAKHLKPGEQLNSSSEGFNQTIKSVDEDWVGAELLIKPFAAGPPEHIHTEFDETFTVTEGVLSMIVDGEVKKLRAGESIFVPRGTAHKPFNETNAIVLISSTNQLRTFPTKFAYHLKQIYPIIDEMGNNPNMLKVVLQLSIYGNEMDTWMAGPPIPMQRALRFIIAPTARLLGFKQ